ncbi:DUF6783 domain-containing protein [Lachnospiraceae bacterium 45-P1]
MFLFENSILYLDEPCYFATTPYRACLKIHSRRLHAPLCSIFGPNSLNVARYAAFIWAKSPTKWNAQLPESNFQTRSNLIGVAVPENIAADGLVE